MSRKRRNTSSAEPDDEAFSPKRRNTHGPEMNYDSEQDDGEVPKLNEFSGQVGAFPGLGGDDSELFYGPANDGIDYLRMVRSEARGVPHILNAPGEGAEPDRTGPDEGVEDGGYYFDGTYTAIDRNTTATDASSLPPAQAHYYESLLAQFRLVRATLRCSPPLAAVEALRPDQFISFPENTRKVRAQWEAHMLAKDPHPVQLACMDTDTVVELVRFIGINLWRFLRFRDPVRLTRVGAWIWALLGKCRERGELSSEEIGELRDLAQNALRMQRGGQGGMALVVVEDESEDERRHADDTPGKDPTGTAKETGGEMTQADKLDEGEVNKQKLLRTTIDMIVTVVGEVYGQRDLLDLRLKWPDEE